MWIYYSVLVAGCAVMMVNAGGQEKCCCPSPLTADVMYRGETLFTNSVDWSIKKAYESYKGRYGLEYILYDMDLMKMYTRWMNGTCRVQTTTVIRHFQCVPESAVHENVSPDNGVTLDGWRYKPFPNADRLMVVTRDQCLPNRMVTSSGDESHVAHFNNVKNSIDSTLFNKNLDDCTPTSTSSSG